MASNLTENQVRDEVRKRLNADKIKLWLPPFTKDNGEKGNDTQAQVIIAKYSASLNLPSDVIAATLEHLRQHAVDKLAARQRFQQEGVASLKMKLTGNVPKEASHTGFDLETKLDISSANLKLLISERTTVRSDHLKLISCGQVLDDQKNLMDQGLRHNSQVMVICLSESEVEARKQEEHRSRLERTKEAAQILAKRNTENRVGGEDDKYYLQIADHTGRPIKLPDEERQALSIALTLNEKGRACLKRKEYAEALVVLLEADQAFRQCRSKILQAVDNYAVLCLDIVWCYLCLQNVDQLPDAESRLKTCEDCFKRSYGEHMERLTVLKGDSSTELALYVRLYLLQGILAFHQCQMPQARTLLGKADGILTSLQVDETKLMQLMAMGYEMAEARLGLRAAAGNVSAAITKILDRRERRQEIAKKEKEEHRQKSLQRKIGKTANGQWVKIDLYEQMLSMGFPKATAEAALKQTNNDLHAALRVIQEHPELLSLQDGAVQNWDGPITDEMLAQITELGFPMEIAREALRRYKGVIERAVQVLVAGGGVLPPLPSVSLAGQSSSKRSESLTDEQKQAIEELFPDIPDHEEDYLDLTLEEEATFIAEYMARVNSAT